MEDKILNGHGEKEDCADVEEACSVMDSILFPLLGVFVLIGLLISVASWAYWRLSPPSNGYDAYEASVVNTENGAVAYKFTGACWNEPHQKFSNVMSIPLVERDGARAYKSVTVAPEMSVLVSRASAGEQAEFRSGGYKEAGIHTGSAASGSDNTNGTADLIRDLVHCGIHGWR